jgi:hypothetical protein
MTNDVYFQIGSVTLFAGGEERDPIVEALRRHEEGPSTSAAAIEAARCGSADPDDLLAPSSACCHSRSRLARAWRASVGWHSRGRYARRDVPAIFVPWFFRLIFERKITEPDEGGTVREIDHAHCCRASAHDAGHPLQPTWRSPPKWNLAFISGRQGRGCAVTQLSPPELICPAPHRDRRAERALDTGGSRSTSGLTALIDEGIANNLTRRHCRESARPLAGFAHRAHPSATALARRVQRIAIDSTNGQALQRPS